MAERLVAEIMQAFKAKIEQHKLETLQHYPNDLMNDQKQLTRLAMAGAKFAWKVGHTGTHLYALGLHPKRNEHVTYVTRDSASDRFYLLEFTSAGYKLTEQDRKEFEGLQRTRIPYQQDGSNESFWLTKDGVRVGHCQNKFTGDAQRPKYASTITPMNGISKLDKEALHEFAMFSVVALAQTLFVGQEEIWISPLPKGRN